MTRPQILTRTDTALLKGLAILAICLHNFCHWLPGMVLENEYTFHRSQTAQLLDAVTGGQHVLLNLLSYFGHYGVPVFLMLSGYGLVMKYESQPDALPSLGRFMWRHAVKLWRLMTVAVVLWIMGALMWPELGWRLDGMDVLGLLTFTVNLMSQPHLHMPLGPWWFFGLMMQLYLLYYIVFRRRGNGWLLAGLVVSAGSLVAAVLLCDRAQAPLNYIRYNCLGQLPAFLLGIYLARRRWLPTRRAALAAMALLVACCWHVWAWLLTPVCAAVAALAFVGRTEEPLAPQSDAQPQPGFWRRAFVALGGLSAWLFVVHPLVRPAFILWAKDGGNVYLALGAYVLAAVALTFCYKTVTLQLFKSPSK